MRLRDYQNEIETLIFEAWLTVTYVLAVLATGGGKTVLFADIVKKHQGVSCIIAHRQEIVTQISLELAECGVYHELLAPPQVRKVIEAEQYRRYGNSFIRKGSPCKLAGVDTLIRKNEPWFLQCTLWVLDEAHHLLKKNKWGRAVQLFPNAKGLGVTATPLRADGAGLGLHADGLFEVLIQGIKPRELIDRGYLAEYKIYCPPSNFQRGDVPVSDSTGEFILSKRDKAVRESKVTGDVVQNYLKYGGPEAKGVTFVIGIDEAARVAQDYRNAGIPAESLSGNTPIHARLDIIRRLREGRIKQLVNDDIVGEGFDLPALQVLQDCQPTQSFSKFAQHFGRVLRPEEGKTAIIIDPVGNVEHFARTIGLPDSDIVWTLDRREKRSNNRPGLIPQRVCLGCSQPFPAIYAVCPICGWTWVPPGQSLPEYVDGDLYLLDPAVLEHLRKQRDQLETPRYFNSLDGIAQLGARARNAERRHALASVKSSLDWWAGWQRSAGLDFAESYRKFYFLFGVDVLSAQLLDTSGLLKLNERIKIQIDTYVNNGVS